MPSYVHAHRSPASGAGRGETPWTARGLAVTKSSDTMEHAADVLADRALAVPGRAMATGVTASAGRPAERNVPGGGVVPASGGHRLDSSARTELERAFRHDFSGVRVHSGPEAAELARGLGARAYTFGRNIVLGGGESVHGDSGRRLLAHELAHVVQYDSSGRAVIARQEKRGRDGRTDDEVRRELEKRTGKSFAQLVLGLGRGPIDSSKISPRDLEEELERNGPLRHREMDTKEPVVIDNVLEKHRSQENRFVSRGRIGPEARINAEKEAGEQAVNDAFVSGTAKGAAGMKPGSASEGLVKPAPEVRGYEPRPPTTYEPRRGAYKPDPPTLRDLAGPRPGEMRVDKGFQNELAVARLTGGRLARDARSAKIGEGGVLQDVEVRYTLPNGQGGVARVDVFGPKQELIQVGGPAKAIELDKTISKLTHLKRAAEASGVSAEAYFTSDTPKPVLDAAGKVLGPGHVHTFEGPEYKVR
ncbi:DUF4157 domain-containing protein [Streptomyces cinnabarinus]|uniref:DUF4157 domain-containing protein n=1 Tax=Streptomyces cinnabarinus TaxID=67287 RepID=A0ABY7KR23_9ACTN|nr:DUF4157 domain-containing protein [Streptomyces cinnabarinus]WAZ26799.1 DUF4157 domain-containing protein [Streptomyces cinnabarinus]